MWVALFSCSLLSLLINLVGGFIESESLFTQLPFKLLTKLDPISAGGELLQPLTF
jgi:hypothetical protein